MFSVLLSLYEAELLLMQKLKDDYIRERREEIERRSVEDGHTSLHYSLRPHTKWGEHLIQKCDNLKKYIATLKAMKEPKDGSDVQPQWPDVLD